MGVINPYQRKLKKGNNAQNYLLSKKANRLFFLIPGLQIETALFLSEKVTSLLLFIFS